MHKATDLFLSLSPERVLAAVEAGGVRCNPVCYALNSYENRVYEVELEDGERMVAKFYRPGRWSEAQILEEHAYMLGLEAEEFPLCGLRRFPDGATLKRDGDIFYCLYDRRGGRAPEELDEDMMDRLGMLTARLHNVGAQQQAVHRRRLDADTYIRDNLDWMLEQGTIPMDWRDRYSEAAWTLADIADAAMEGIATHAVHGDLHMSNLLLRHEVFLFLDFDDMVVGPAVQDLWLLLPGDDDDGSLREAWIEGYERFRPFDRASLALIDPLRGMRYVHYTAWLARRWHDPVFPRTFPHFGSAEYWEQETRDLEELVARLDDSGPQTWNEPEEELGNEDFFWDWED